MALIINILILLCNLDLRFVIVSFYSDLDQMWSRLKDEFYSIYRIPRYVSEIVL